MKAEFKEKFFEIPFGQLSGHATTLTSLMFLAALLLLKGFHLEDISKYILLFGLAQSFLLNGSIFNYLVQKKVDQIHENISPESGTHMNALFGFNGAYTAFDLVPELLFVLNASVFGLTPWMALTLLFTAKIIGGQLISLLLDRIPYKLNLGMAIFAVSVSFLLYFSFERTSITLKPFIPHIIICLKGVFGNLLAVIRSHMLLHHQNSEGKAPENS